MGPAERRDRLPQAVPSSPGSTERLSCYCPARGSRADKRCPSDSAPNSWRFREQGSTGRRGQAKRRTGVKAEQVLPEMGDGLTFRAEEKQGGLVGSGWGGLERNQEAEPTQGRSQGVPGRAPGDWVWAAQGLDQCRARGVPRWWPCRGGECWACRHPAPASGAVQCGCSAEPAGALGKGRLQPGGRHLQGARRGPQRPGHRPGPSAGEGQARGARLLR